MPEYAVLVVDMLEEFVRGRLRAENAEKIVEPIRKLVAFAREKGIPVIYTIDQHHPEIDYEFRLWGPHAVRGSAEAKIISELAPRENEYIVAKRRYDAFMFTDLDMLLRELGVKNLIVTGIHTHVCVLQTVMGAFYRGYTVIVPEECVAAFDNYWHKVGLEYMKNYAGAQIVKLGDLISRLNSELQEMPSPV
jgi:nicotinamidase-related amidase|uniref:Cysteine hydrolase n=1 Tax=Thermofilum adornatum TaxID=1365176 RepID=A0A7C1GJU8_9CREN